ncbi:longitudinals lacking protein, isoforms A/B/D/L isoform X2 [Diabrotica undecimpunctata]|uniref:longitudinals lacking protein, isoforms A/B/D/L isoform X2 n=1 Tax=Diabrotica undecimpunctata TaxID=50387 RepID=UPI003B63544B
MDDDQQFCLRWNNHQSTLVAVFDTLLENGTLVDCTLAAEGKCLNAHKVVLSACSPYFEALLSKHFDKHPILILKDVKFQELKAMMDYMYRGEVNISQDQLGALLKAAESLQIKGLSDNRKGETDRKPTPAPPPKSPQPTTLPKVQGLTIEQRAREDSREGSMSPGPRKKKRLRRKSEELDNHDASNSSESHSLPAQSIPTLPAISKMNMNADVPEQIETKSEILTRHKQTDDMPQVPIIKEKIETHTELMLEPKSEYVEEMNEDSIEDLTLDDDDLSNMEQVDDQAGPSHGAGEGSSQGFGGWHMGNQSQDEVFLAAQEAVGAHRDSQAEDLRIKKNTWENWPSHFVLPMMLMRENMKQSMLQSLNRTSLDLSISPKPRNKLSPETRDGGFVCGDCGRTYKLKSSLRNHQKWECGKEPQFKCPFCVYKAKQKMHMARHMERMHREIDYSSVKSEVKTEEPESSQSMGDNKEMEITSESNSVSNT